MSIDLWISVLLAIPLAIVGNLLTPPVGKWLSNRLETSRHRKIEGSKKRRAAQLKLLTKEIERIRELHSNPAKLTEYLLYVLVQIAALGAIASVYGGIFNFIGEFGKWQGIAGIIGRSGGQIITLFLSLLIFQISYQALKLRRRVRDFDDYEKRTLKVIGTLQKALGESDNQTKADQAISSETHQASSVTASRH